MLRVLLYTELAWVRRWGPLEVQKQCTTWEKSSFEGQKIVENTRLIDAEFDNTQVMIGWPRPLNIDAFDQASPCLRDDEMKLLQLDDTAGRSEIKWVIKWENICFD